MLAYKLCVWLSSVYMTYSNLNTGILQSLLVSDSLLMETQIVYYPKHETFSKISRVNEVFFRFI